MDLVYKRCGPGCTQEVDSRLHSDWKRKERSGADTGVRNVHGGLEQLREFLRENKVGRVVNGIHWGVLDPVRNVLERGDWKFVTD
jgi:hypothetical protein